MKATTKPKIAGSSNPKQPKGSQNKQDTKGNARTSNKRQHKNSTQPASISADTTHPNENLEINNDISRKRFKMTIPSNDIPIGPQFYRSTKEYLEGIEIKNIKQYSYLDRHSKIGLTIDEYINVKQNEFAQKYPEFKQIEEKEIIKQLQKSNQNEDVSQSKKEVQGEVFQKEIKIQSEQWLSKEKQDYDKHQYLEQNSINTKNEGKNMNKEEIKVQKQETISSFASLNNNFFTQNNLNNQLQNQITLNNDHQTLEYLQLNEYMRGHPCSELVHSNSGVLGQDEPNGIIQMEAHPWKQGESIYLVTWIPRKKKIQLLPSWVNASTFKLAFPQLVIDFYQSYIRLKN